MPVNWMGDKFARAVHQSVSDAVSAGAKVAQRAEKGLLSQPGTGRSYPRPTRIHRASAPGKPPAVDTGHLRRSVQIDLSDARDRNPKARVGTNLPYAPMLEFGTRRMAPRPSWRLLTRKPIIGHITNAMFKMFAHQMRRRSPR